MNENTFSRMSINNIREFVLYDTSETGNKNNHPYMLRKKEEESKIMKRLEKIYADNADALDEALYDLSDCIVTTQDIYFEIGFAFGISLANQMQDITSDEDVKKLLRALIDR